MAISEEQEQDLNENMEEIAEGDINAEGEKILRFAQVRDLG